MPKGTFSDLLLELDRWSQSEAQVDYNSQWMLLRPRKVCQSANKDAQADLSHRWAPMSGGRLSHIAAQI